jgi:hypothetical protein
MRSSNLIDLRLWCHSTALLRVNRWLFLISAFSGVSMSPVHEAIQGDTGCRNIRLNNTRALTLSLILMIVALSVAAAQPIAGGIEAASDSLCKTSEEVVFSCFSQSKNISLCATPDAAASHGSLTYRFGSLGHPVELEYPSSPVNPKHAFTYAAEFGAKGGTEQVTFSVARYRYTLYNIHWGGVEPEFISGIVVEHAGERIATLRCTEPEVQFGLWHVGKRPQGLGSRAHYIGLDRDRLNYDVP